MKQKNNKWTHDEQYTSNKCDNKPKNNNELLKYTLKNKKKQQ